MPGIRASTDKKRQAFDAEVGKVNLGAMPALKASVGAAQECNAGLAEFRTRASRHEITLPEHVSAYSQTIARLLDIIWATGQFNSDAGIGQRLLAYLSFVRAKE